MKSGTAMTIPAITVTSRWQSKRLGIEVRVSRVTIRTVSYRTLDFTFSRTLPQWQFLQVFQPATGEEEAGQNRHEYWDFTQLTNTAKCTVAVTLNLTSQEVDLHRKAGESLYGKGHLVTLVIRQFGQFLRISRTLHTARRNHVPGSLVSPTKWKPGQSGNPSGRISDKKDIARQIARSVFESGVKRE